MYIAKDFGKHQHTKQRQQAGSYCNRNIEQK
jgi:hypothetical protein